MRDSIFFLFISNFLSLSNSQQSFLHFLVSFFVFPKKKEFVVSKNLKRLEIKLLKKKQNPNNPNLFLRLNTKMFRSMYDSDVTIWSPQGRIHQLEYAMEAVKQGSAVVGAKSKTHAVLAALMRTPSEMSSYQEKIFKIDDHLAIAISGLTADGRYLCKYMRNECLNHKLIYDSPMPVERLIKQISDSKRETSFYCRKHFYKFFIIKLQSLKCTPNNTEQDHTEWDSLSLDMMSAKYFFTKKKEEIDPFF